MLGLSRVQYDDFEIVAFTDDAVPEPTLLTYFIAPFLGVKSVLWVVL